VVDSPLAVWSVFISGVLAAVILLSAFVAAVVLAQRRYLNLHRRFARKILEAQEEERAWVSREVHDDAVQRVGLIRRQCASLVGSEVGVGGEAGGGGGLAGSRVQDELRAIQDELGDLSAFLRGLAHRLHPPLIDRAGLRAALASLCDDVVRAHGVQITYRCPPEDQAIPIRPPAAIALYRIAQEALQNTVKHAAVPEALLELLADGDMVEVVIRDRGAGFNQTAAARSSGGGGGIGLMAMRERAILAGGTLSITSAPGAGTEVRARVPSESRAGADHE